MCAAIYVAAAWALADQLDGGRLHPEQWLGAAAVVCGAGLIVGTLLGRARWLIVPALLAALGGFVAGTTARLGIPPSDAFGERIVSIGQYTTRTELDERVGIGNLELAIDSAPPAPVHIDARVGIGLLQLHVRTRRHRRTPPAARQRRHPLDQAGVGASAPSLIGSGSTPDVVVDAWGRRR